MIRQYENKKIERNLKVTKILFLISLCFSVITVIIYLITRYITKTAKVYDSEWYFYFLAFATPIAPLLFQDFGVETEKHNDFLNTLAKIMLVHMEIFVLIFFSVIFGIIAAFDGGDDYSFGLSYFIGYCLPAHSFSYIASYILIWNCVMIKSEWKENPPYFLKKAYEEKKHKHNNTSFKLLIEKCGMKFFIKYYAQIKRLPLRDVAITENYNSEEREERLNAAKKIIDLDLVEFAFNEILKEYSDILDDSEIERVKALLAEIQTDNQGSSVTTEENTDFPE